MTRRIFFGLILIAILATGAAAAATAHAGPLSPELQAVRAAVAKYHSYDEALAAGYSAAGEPCVSSPAGTMGYHASNAALIRSGRIDPLKPPILLYVPRADGSLGLAGVEYWKADADQNIATDDDRPSLFGQPFNGPMPGHNPTMPIHYDLHVWVVGENPAGVFAQFNPSLRC